MITTITVFFIALFATPDAADIIPGELRALSGYICGVFGCDTAGSGSLAPEYSALRSRIFLYSFKLVVSHRC
jgi:hypothetical protein